MSRKEVNMTQNVVAYLKQQEDRRANFAREAETQRHNEMVETLTREQQREAARHNYASEYLSAQTLEHNRKQLEHQGLVLQETKRSNMAQEALSSQRNILTAQYNQGQLAIAGQQLKEATRHNLVSEYNQVYSTNVQKMLGTRQQDTNQGNLLVNVGRAAIDLFKAIW